MAVDLPPTDTADHVEVSAVVALAADDDRDCPRDHDQGGRDEPLLDVAADVHLLDDEEG